LVTLREGVNILTFAAGELPDGERGP